jgi:hypothetical protein
MSQSFEQGICLAQRRSGKNLVVWVKGPSMSDVEKGQTILCANRAATSLPALSTSLDALCEHVIDF